MIFWLVFLQLVQVQYCICKAFWDCLFLLAYLGYVNT